MTTVQDIAKTIARHFHRDTVEKLNGEWLEERCFSIWKEDQDVHKAFQSFLP